MAQSNTQDRILDAAEVLFAEHGYDGTSLRAITGAAGVNVAAVHYHFGGKLALFVALFERRVGPINAERLERLDRLEERGAAAPPALAELLEAFLGPAVRLSRRPDLGAHRFVRIVGRVHAAPGEHVDAIKDVFSEVQRRFFPAFARAAPHLTEADLYWRLHLVFGAMCSVLADPLRLERWSEGRCRSTDPDEALAQLVTVATAALQAPSVSLERASRP